MSTAKVRYDNLKPAVAKVLSFSRARVESERWVAFRSWAGIDAFYCRPGLIGAHKGRGGGPDRLELDHYLEALAHKPGALSGATALEQARAGGTFTAVHEGWWAAARRKHGGGRHPGAAIGGGQ